MEPSQKSLEPQVDARTAWLFTALALGVTLVAFAPAFVHRSFSYDDAEAILENPVVKGELDLIEAFRRDYWAHRGAVGHYRPTATVSLAIDHALFGDDARGYRVTNWILHAAILCLASLWWRRLRAGFVPLGLMLFGALPWLADSVAWISGRTSMLAVLPPLAVATAGFVRPGIDRRLWYVLAWSGAFLGLCAKEDALGFLPLIVVCARGKRRLPTGLVVATALAAYLGLRFHVYGEALPTAHGAPLADVSLLERLAHGGRALVGIVTMDGYTPSYRGHPEYAADRGVAAGYALVSIGVLLAATAPWALVLRRGIDAGPRWALVGVAGLALVPVTQLVPIAEPLAPRYVYAAFVALAPVAALARHPALVSVTVLVIGFGLVRTRQAVEVYADRASHARAILEIVPTDVVAWTSLGLAEFETGDLDAARQALERAVELDPSHGRAWSNLASIAVEEGDLERASDLYRRALQHFEANGVAWINLGQVEHRLGRHERALAAYTRATELLPKLANAWRGRATALFELGRNEEARRALERAEALAPGDAFNARLRKRLER